MLTWMSGALMVLLVGGWVVLNQTCGERYHRLGRLSMDGLRLQRLAPPLLFLLERGKFRCASRLYSTGCRPPFRRSMVCGTARK